MEVEYKKKAQEDRVYWKEQGNLKIQNRISELIIEI